MRGDSARHAQLSEEVSLEPTLSEMLPWPLPKGKRPHTL